MKTIRLICMFLTVLLISSCNSHGDMNENDNGTDLNDSIIDSPYPFYEYEPLRFSVQDTFGEDLLKRIGTNWWGPDSNPADTSFDGSVNRDLYTLDVVYPDPRMNPYYSVDRQYETIDGIPDIIIHSEYVPLLSIIIEENCYYMCMRAQSNNYGSILPAEKIVFKLRCPILFGDNGEYMIITYWEKLEIEGVSISDRFKCKCIEFEGKEINFQRIPEYETDERYCHTLATIILKEKESLK